MAQSVAFIGTGIMGLPMARRLLAAGVALTVHTRTRSRAQPLIESGAIWADSPAEAAGANVVLVCVSDTPDVQSVLLGEGGVVAGAKAGTIVVDHSTISPTATVEMAAQLAEKQITLIDAPVSGGDVGAQNGTLSIMCGGQRAAFEAVTPLLQHLGKTITYCGESGRGQLTKLVNQVLVFGTVLAVSEAIAFAKAGGLDLPTTLAAIGSGAGRGWQLEQLGPKMAADDFAPGFMIDLAAKDLRLVMEFAEQKNLKLPGASLVQRLYEQLQAQGDGRLGTQGLLRAIVPA
ncbi:MAG TPA: NAD(P)-dependent oxidoreductase [Tepidisphaeraceae bacterium]|jgi:3-hydroxyisobutyrate dehydrogenase